jgi:3-phenylpropionate/trans-cinnamate dioxygenase ferredoxin component
VEVRVASEGEIPAGGVKIIQAGSLFVGVYLIDGTYYAIEDRCSHDDGPLCEGERDGFCIECPRHGATFDLRSGAVLSLPATEGVDVYSVSVRDGGIFIQT